MSPQYLIDLVGATSGAFIVFTDSQNRLLTHPLPPLKKGTFGVMRFLKRGGCGRGRVRPKRPKIDREYHSGKGKLKISVHGYALESKKSRELPVRIALV